ncbi:oxidoreductase [Mesorhizobium loti]|nr:NAD-dependent epimerase/dehydratase family protein [Mesorhizobium loti]PLP59912.1 oxidoreductase [Mesorhizobium loti]
MTSIAILGANGRLGRAVGKAFVQAGYDVRGITRSGRLPADLAGATGIAANALDREALVRATTGVDIVFHGLNPIYSDWSTVLPMAENVVAACEANGAVLLFPGTIYNYGSPLPEVITENTPFNPTTEKGRIRVALETMLRTEAEAGRMRTILLRAGDFFGGSGTGSWFDLVMVSKIEKGVYTAAGPTDIVHEWAYLPDLAAAFVALADRLDQLGDYETLHFPGHAITDLEMKAALERAVDRKLAMASMPWWVFRVAAPFIPMWKAIVQMSYLRFEPHRLVSERLEGLIGQVPHTPLDRAVAEALTDLGIPVASVAAQMEAA